MAISTAIVVKAMDQYNNIATTASGSVQMSLSMPTVGAALGGTTNVPLTNGIAIFSNLMVSGYVYAASYQLQASMSGMTANKWIDVFPQATKLSLSLIYPITPVMSSCLKIYLKGVNENYPNAIAKVAESTDVSLTTTGGFIYPNPECTDQIISSVTLTPQASTYMFYFKQDTESSVTLTATPFSTITSGALNMEVYLPRMSAGIHHSCATVLQSGGSVVVKCWGSNTYGEVGNGVGVGAKALSPVPVGNFPTGRIRSLSAGRDHTCAVVENATTQKGEAWCWGNNTYGQLGNGLYADMNTPVKVTDTAGSPFNSVDVKSIAAGGNFTCAVVDSAGYVYCWGQNDDSQLGINPGTPNSNKPLQILGLYGVSAISAGKGSNANSEEQYACAIQNSGGVTCWGSTLFGRLGMGSNYSYPSYDMPQTGIDGNGNGLTGVTSISVGVNHACAVASGSAKCWGYNLNGQLGNGSSINTNSATPLSSLYNVKSISAGQLHTCAVVLDTTNAKDRVMCWGSYTLDKLGVSPTVTLDQPIPVFATSLDNFGNARSVEVGQNFSCGFVGSGLFCWGAKWGTGSANYNGEIGNGWTDGSETPFATISY
ncbi:MAG: hypothetical protein AABZ06_07035 [Bdellovibrionota bacterium]